jgi:hypothetical protein
MTKIIANFVQLDLEGISVHDQRLYNLDKLSGQSPPQSQRMSMKQQLAFRLIIILSCFMLSACNLFTNTPGFALFKGNMAVEGPTPIMNKPSIEDINLTKLFDLGSEPISQTIETWDDGFAYFERNVIRNTTNTDDQRRVRNSLQDRIIAASNQRCGEYRDFLKRFDSETNITLGWLTTAMAGAGAIATPVNTIRALSGIAAILSGWRAEVNESYFNKLTIQVITTGIDFKRKEVQTLITEKQKKLLSEYSLQAAIADAANYHQNCSLISGLEHAALSVQRADDPGLAAASRTLKEIRRLRQIQETPLDQPLPLEAMQTAGLRDEDFLRLDSLVDSPLEAFSDAKRRAATTAAQFNKHIDDLRPSDDFKGEKDIDNTLKLFQTLVTNLGQESIKKLTDETRTRAEDQDAKLRKQQANMNGTIDKTERQKKQNQLRLDIIDGRKITLDITEIDLQYSLSMQRSRSTLDDGSIKPVAARIKQARDIVKELLVTFLDGRIDRSADLLKKVDEKTDDGQSRVKAIAKQIFNDDSLTKTQVLLKMGTLKSEFDKISKSDDMASFNKATTDLSGTTDSLNKLLK